jgi:hypothetical protein
LIRVSAYGGGSYRALAKTRTRALFERLPHSIFFDCHQNLHGSEEQTFFRESGKYPFRARLPENRKREGWFIRVC